ncbi:MAG TPA: spore cortex-lytic enzyme [Verrucomicrobiae bacterium]|nr:spore cortex-lytic enzyme [Verrucomicrobiae bacterium]
MIAGTLVLILVLTVALQAALGDRSLSRRASGEDVRELQSRLKQLGYVVGPIDGKYGRKTEAAVRRFQKGQGIKVDGIAGAATINRLKKMTGAHTNAGGKVVGRTSNDLSLLARAVNGEARGEPYKGQVAVAAVLLNRLKDSRFPKSIAAIIYQPGAFSSVNDGQINLPPSSEALRAAREAMNGSDPSHGALYFFAPAKTSNRFIWSRPQICRIGNHIFTK